MKGGGKAENKKQDSMNNLQTLEKEIEKALVVISKLRQEKQQLLSRVRELQLALKEIDKLKIENISWQKDKDMVKLKLTKVLNNLEALKQTSGESNNE